MSYNPNTGLITGSVSVTDVQYAIGSSSRDDGTLFCSDNINKWSKYKPISWSGKKVSDNIYDNDNWKNNNCGLQFSTISLATYPQGIENQWKYVWHKTAPYNLGDFKGYYSKATSPFTSFTADSQDITSGIYNYIAGEPVTFNFGIKTNTSTSEIRLADITQNSRTLNNWQRGIIMVNTETGYGELLNNQIKTSGSGTSMSLTATESASMIGGYMRNSAKYLAYPVMTNLSQTLSTSTTRNIISMDGLKPIEIVFHPSTVEGFPEQLYWYQDHHFVLQMFLANRTTSAVSFTSINVEGGIYHRYYDPELGEERVDKLVEYNNTDLGSNYISVIPDSLTTGSTFNSLTDNRIISRGGVGLNWTSDTYPTEEIFQGLPEGSFIKFKINATYRVEGETQVQSTSSIFSQELVIKGDA